VKRKIMQNNVNRKNSSLLSTRRTYRFLVVLYSTIEYDGRAQRMIDVLSTLGEVLLVDIAAPFDRKNDELVGKWLLRKSVKLPTRIGRMARHIKFWMEVIQVAKRYKPNVIVAEDFLTTLPSWLAARMGGSRLIYDAHELIIPDQGRKMSKRAMVWYLLERWVVARADLVIAANPERAELMAEHYRLQRVPEYMRNIPPRRQLTSEEERHVSRSYPSLNRKSTEDRIILYQGVISLKRGLARFIDALGFLPSNYRLILVGDGPDLVQVKQLGERWEKEGRFIALGRVPNLFLPALTARADVGIVTYPYEGLNNIYCAPNKLYEYTQAGLPVIATDQPPLKSVVRKYQIGVVISRNDGPREIAALLQELINRKDNYCANLNAFIKAHRWEKEASRVRLAIEGVLKTIDGI